jgi:DNA-binding transcriptional LysR family regulator
MALPFTVRQLEYFVAVGDSGSIARAAERVNVSSPSISAAIAQLEESLGVQLFIRRHAHGLSLTPGGRRVMAEARDLLERAARLQRLAADIAETFAGPLSVGCLSTFAPVVLPELRRRFETEYPEVRIRQVEADHQRLMEWLGNAEVDICLTYDLEMPAGVAFEPLAELHPQVMLPPGHPLAGAAALTPEDLAPYPMVLIDLPHSGDYFLSAFVQAGLKPRVEVRVPDMTLARSMVANGYGFCLVNMRPLADVAPDGKPLVYKPYSGGLRPLRMGLARSRGLHRSRVVEAFEAHCRAAISPAAIPGLRMQG